MKKILNFAIVCAFFICCSVLFYGCFSKQYSITISSTENGEVYTQQAKANAGEKIKVFVYASDGYVLKQDTLKANDTLIENFEFEMPECDVVISAQFVPAQHSINYNTDEWTTHSNPLTFDLTTEIVLTDATKPGYHFDGWYTTSDFSSKITKINTDNNNFNIYPKFKQIFVYSIYNNKAQIKDLTDYGDTLADLYIPSKIDGYDVSVVSVQRACQNIKTLTIEDGVEDINPYLSFWGSEKLTTVNLPKSIGIWGYPSSPLFKNCTSLTTINLDPQNPNIYQKDGVIYKFTSGTHYEVGYYEYVYMCCYPNGKTDSSFVIPDEVTHLLDFGKAKFSSVTLSKNLISCISENPFAECENLTQISVNSSNTAYVANQNNLYKITDTISTIRRCTLIFSASKSKILDLSQTFAVNGQQYRVTDVFETALNQASIEKFIVDFDVIDVDIFKNCPNIKMLSTKQKPNPTTWSEQDRYADVLACNNIYWYSETKPSTSGNYWYYNSNNNIVLWN